MKSLRTLINGAIAGAGTAFAGLVLATGLMALPVETAHAQWFRCQSAQYNLETTSNRARCIKPASKVRVQPDAGCPLGTTLAQDHSGNIDFCIPVTGTVGPKPFSAKCGPGQEVERRNGRDRCHNTTPADIKPVSTPG